MKLALLIGLAALLSIPTLTCLFAVAVAYGRRNESWRDEDAIDYGDSTELSEAPTDWQIPVNRFAESDRQFDDDYSESVMQERVRRDRREGHLED